MFELLDFMSSDYDEVATLWRGTERLVPRDVDERDAIVRYLMRDPGLSFVARERGSLIGAVLCEPRTCQA